MHTDVASQVTLQSCIASHVKSHVDAPEQVSAPSLTLSSTAVHVDAPEHVIMQLLVVLVHESAHEQLLVHV